MAVEIELDKQATVDDLLSLRNSLGQEDDLRGRITLLQGKTPPDALGALTDVISVALVPGGAIGALAAVLTTWIRQRTSDISITVHGADGNELTLDAKRVKRADVHELSTLTAELESTLGKINGRN